MSRTFVSVGVCWNQIYNHVCGSSDEKSSEPFCFASARAVTPSRALPFLALCMCFGWLVGWFGLVCFKYQCCLAGLLNMHVLCQDYEVLQAYSNYIAVFQVLIVSYRPTLTILCIFGYWWCLMVLLKVCSGVSGIDGVWGIDGILQACWKCVVVFEVLMVSCRPAESVLWCLRYWWCPAGLLKVCSSVWGIDGILSGLLKVCCGVWGVDGVLQTCWKCVVMFEVLMVSCRPAESVLWCLRCWWCRAGLLKVCCGVWGIDGVVQACWKCVVVFEVLMVSCRPAESVLWCFRYWWCPAGLLKVCCGVSGIDGVW